MMTEQELLVPGNVLLYGGRSVAYVDETKTAHWLYRDIIPGKHFGVLPFAPTDRKEYKLMFNIKEVPEMWRELHKDD